jgi:subfamily B ATP-binding cassette protein MsbA
VLPAVVILGALSSLGEGIGISLFIPLVSSFAGNDAPSSGGGPLIALLAGLFNSIPAGRRLPFICAAIVVCITAKGLLAYANNFLLNWLDTLICSRLRTELFNRLLTARYSVFERISQSKFYHALNIQAWRTSEALHALLYFAVFGCTISVYLVLLLLISWRLTVFALVSLFFISWLSRAATRRATHIGELNTEGEKVLDERIVEGLSGMREIRTFGREDYEAARFGGAADNVRKVNLRLSNIQNITAPLQEVLAVTFLVSILMLGGIRSVQDLSPILVFTFLLFRLQPGFVGVESSRVHMRSLEADVNSLFALLEETGEPPSASGKMRFDALKDCIKFDQVGFSYDSKTSPALRQISFEIPAGKVTALVGPSGAGKTTLVNLILRFYEPTEGRILVDGSNLEDVAISAWRERIAMVNQDPFFFNTTIWQNIAYGKASASNEEVIQAAIRAHAHDFISQLPEGYNSPMGNRGSLLSAGQRQRIALARAIIRDPEILILDEATNALDSISENAVQRSLEELRKERTVIVIAHRLSTIEHADTIIVVEHGKVAEAGGFRQLMKNNGLFVQMYRMQHGGLLV